MHPDASRLLAAEASLRSEADAMLAASGIGAILAGQGRTWAQARHGDIDDFVARMAALVLGTDTAPDPADTPG